MTGAALDAQLFLSLVLVLSRLVPGSRQARVQERDFLDGGEGKLGSDGLQVGRKAKEKTPCPGVPWQPWQFRPGSGMAKEAKRGQDDAKHVRDRPRRGGGRGG